MNGRQCDAVVLGGLLLALVSCGSPASEGSCGTVLASGECAIVRTQLGTLPLFPPANPTNRWGRYDGTQQADKQEEDRAVALGRRLFFDTCLSVGRDTSCSTCHDPKVALIDARNRELLVDTMLGTEMVRRAGIDNPTEERLKTPPPLVMPRRDASGAPLAKWDAAMARWVGVTRRPQTSISSAGATYTPRNSPTVYNIVYGTGAPALDGGRTAGAVWVPWDGRYDSIFALSADVWEFGATHRTNRTHLARRISHKHASEYDAAFKSQTGGIFDYRDKGRYPKNASPNTAFNSSWVDCWQKGMCPTGDAVPTDAVKQEINTVFVNAGKAVEAYMRRLRSANSAYDRFVRGDHSTAKMCSAADPTCPEGESCDRKTNRCVMSIAAQRGLRLFIGKAECIMCHGGPNFTDWRFHNLGVSGGDPEGRSAGSRVVSQDPIKPPSNPPLCSFPGAPPALTCHDQGRFAWQNKLAGACEPEQDPNKPARTCQRSDGQSCFADNLGDSRKRFTDDPNACVPVDLCRYTDEESCKKSGCSWYRIGMRPCVPAPTPEDQGAFKTPSLRNVARTWPYMHNGSIHDYGPTGEGTDAGPHLFKVIEFYNQGGGMAPVGRKDPLIRPLGLTLAEMSDLVEFLKALSDESLFGTELLTVPSDLVDTTDCKDLN